MYETYSKLTVCAIQIKSNKTYSNLTFYAFRSNKMQLKSLNKSISFKFKWQLFKIENSLLCA